MRAIAERRCLWRTDRVTITAHVNEITMTTTYVHILDLVNEAEPPADGILSRTIHQDDQTKAVVFGFGQGQELSEHTASTPAMLFFVKGEATWASAMTRGRPNPARGFTCQRV